jgi:hypothetical protein
MSRKNPWFEMDVADEEEADVADSETPGPPHADFDSEPDRRTWLERLTASAPFGVLFGVSFIVAVPAFVLGLLALPFMIGGLASGPDAALSLGIAAVLGGGAGLAGIARANPLRSRLHPSGIATTQVLLMIGVATALAMLATAVMTFGREALRGGLAQIMFLLLTGVLVVMSLKAVADVIALQRQSKSRAEENVSQVADKNSQAQSRDESLPWLFLAMALAQAGAAVVLNANLG